MLFLHFFITQITCAQGAGDWLLIEEWKQLGAFPSQPIVVWRRPFSEGLKEVGNNTQVAVMLILNLSLTLWELHSIRLPAISSGLFRPCDVFLAAPHHSSGETVFILTPLETWNTFSFYILSHLGFVGAHLFDIPGRGICLLVYCPSSGHWGISPTFTCFLFTVSM